jgi:hypothetical protein
MTVASLLFAINVRIVCEYVLRHGASAFAIYMRCGDPLGHSVSFNFKWLQHPLEKVTITFIVAASRTCTLRYKCTDTSITDYASMY